MPCVPVLIYCVSLAVERFVLITWIAVYGCFRRIHMRRRCSVRRRIQNILSWRPSVLLHSQEEHRDKGHKSSSGRLLYIQRFRYSFGLCATAIKHKFIGKPLKIQIFHTKNTPVHWGKFHPIKQEYSLVQRKKFIGMKTRFYTYQSHLHCIACPKEKAEKALRRNQKLATSLDFS